MNTQDVRFCFRTKDNKEEIKVFKGLKPILLRQEKIVRSELERELGKDSEERTLPDSTYNCHGMTFISKLGFIATAQREKKSIIIPGEQECLYDEETGQRDLERILNGNDFKLKIDIPNLKVDMDRITPNINIYLGDVVLYLRDKKFTHSCIIYGKKFYERHAKIKVLSKLGMGGEYFHYIDNEYIVRQYGNHIQIWSDSEKR